MTSSQYKEPRGAWSSTQYLQYRTWMGVTEENCSTPWQGLQVRPGNSPCRIILFTRSPIFHSLLWACPYLALNIEEENKMTKPTHAINKLNGLLGMLCRHQGIVIRDINYTNSKENNVFSTFMHMAQLRSAPPCAISTTRACPIRHAHFPLWVHAYLGQCSFTWLT